MEEYGINHYYRKNMEEELMESMEKNSECSGISKSAAVPLKISINFYATYKNKYSLDCKHYFDINFKKLNECKYFVYKFVLKLFFQKVLYIT